MRSRTGPKNPHRSGLWSEPRPFSEPFVDNRRVETEEGTIYVNSARERAIKEEALRSRNQRADAAYEAALAPARLPLGHPDRVPYPEAVKSALSAYGAVIEEDRA